MDLLSSIKSLGAEATKQQGEVKSETGETVADVIAKPDNVPPVIPEGALTPQDVSAKPIDKPQEPKEVPQNSTVELTDEQLLELVNKRGIKLPVKEEIKKSDDEIEAELMDFGVKNGLKIDDFVRAKEVQKKADKDLVIESLKEKYPKLNDEGIEKKFNKLYAEAETDEETGDVKYKFDDDEIKQDAKRIREQVVAPINGVKNKFQEHTAKQRIEAQAKQEFNQFAKNFPEKINFQVDEKNSFEYLIEPEIKKQLIPILEQGYIAERIKAPNEKFDLNEYTKFVVRNMNWGNVMNVYAKNESDKVLREHLKPFENPIEEPLKLNGTSQPTVDMEAEQKRVTKLLPRV